MLLPAACCKILGPKNEKSEVRPNEEDPAKIYFGGKHEALSTDRLMSHRCRRRRKQRPCNGNAAAIVIYQW